MYFGTKRWLNYCIDPSTVWKCGGYVIITVVDILCGNVIAMEWQTAILCSNVVAQ